MGNTDACTGHREGAETTCVGGRGGKGIPPIAVEVITASEGLLRLNDGLQGPKVGELCAVAGDAVGMVDKVGRVEVGLTFASGAGELTRAVPETVGEEGDRSDGVDGVVVAGHDSGEGGCRCHRRCKDGSDGARDGDAVPFHVESDLGGRCGGGGGWGRGVT